MFIINLDVFHIHIYTIYYLGFLPMMNIIFMEIWPSFNLRLLWTRSFLLFHQFYSVFRALQMPFISMCALFKWCNSMFISLNHLLPLCWILIYEVIYKEWEFTDVHNYKMFILFMFFIIHNLRLFTANLYYIMTHYLLSIKI